MKRFMATVLCIGVAVVAVLAAPREVRVVFHSDPEGAMLYANAIPQQFGYTPYVLKYKTSKEFQRGKACHHVQQAMVRWASGVEASIDSLDLCPDNGGTQQFTFVRPDVPGREVDANFALELAKIAALREATAAASEPIYVPMPAYRPPPQTHCTSTLIGNQIFTNCY